MIRTGDLGINEQVASSLIAQATELFKLSSPTNGPVVHARIDDFFEALARDMEQEALDSDEAASPMANTNACVDQILIGGISRDGALAFCAGPGRFLEGVISMDQDEDKPFHGDTGNGSVRATFDLVGRVGLIRTDIEVFAGLDATSQDDDFENDPMA